MAKIKVTIHNPYGLSAKQRLVIDDIVADIQHGRGFNAKRSTKKFYNVKNDKVAAVIACQNLTRLNFQQALADKIKKGKIVDIIGQKLSEGLDAVDGNGNTDHTTRLRYIQEIHKIIGIYPQ